MLLLYPGFLVYHSRPLRDLNGDPHKLAVLGHELAHVELKHGITTSCAAGYDGLSGMGMMWLI